MKTDRLLAIITYLLSREHLVSAKHLADKFEVTPRTIQRDIEAIAMAGIPIYAEKGTNGGYQIIPEYKLRNQLMKDEDFDNILLALKSLGTGYQVRGMEDTLTKYLAVGNPRIEPRVFWDLGVSAESKEITVKNRMLEDAIKCQRTVKFSYINIQGIRSEKRVQPLALQYKWYAWYLFAFDTEKKDYRRYKVARMGDVCLLSVYHDDHGDIEGLIAEMEKGYSDGCITIKILCPDEIIELLAEYFPDCFKEPAEGGCHVMHLRVPENERLWKALLLSFGNKIKILAPESYCKELALLARDFYQNYDI